MLQPIELLKKELAELRVVANRRGFSKLKREANTLIPSYENSIKFMEAVNGVDASHHQALHKHIVSKAKRTCPKCGSHKIIMFTSDLDICQNCNTTLDGA